MNNVIELRVDASREVSGQDQHATMALAMAEAYPVIDCAEVCTLASTELRQIVTRKRDLNESRLKITRPMDQAKAEVMALFAPALARLDQAEQIIKGRIGVFLESEEHRRREEEARQAEQRRLEQARADAEAAELRRQADEKATAERKAAQEAHARAEAAAREQERQALEARKAGDAQAAREAEEQAALVRKQADEDAMAAAQRAEQVRIDAENEAQSRQMAAAVMPAAIVASTKVAGVSRSGRWKAEVTDMKALVAFVAQHPEYLHLLEVNTTTCNAAAQSQQENMRIDGLKAVRNNTVASRGARAT